MLAQCALSILYALPIWLALYPLPENPKVPIVGALIGGFALAWGTIFVYVWARFGWTAARSMSLDVYLPQHCQPPKRR